MLEMTKIEVIALTKNGELKGRIERERFKDTFFPVPMAEFDEEQLRKVHDVMLLPDFDAKSELTFTFCPMTATNNHWQAIALAREFAGIRWSSPPPTR